MRYKQTILNIITAVYILCCILYSIINYSVLSEGEGWGIVSMIGLMGIGVSVLILDFVIQLVRHIYNPTDKNQGSE